MLHLEYFHNSKGMTPVGMLWSLYWFVNVMHFSYGKNQRFSSHGKEIKIFFCNNFHPADSRVPLNNQMGMVLQYCQQPSPVFVWLLFSFYENIHSVATVITFISWLKPRKKLLKE